MLRNRIKNILAEIQWLIITKIDDDGKINFSIWKRDFWVSGNDVIYGGKYVIHWLSDNKPHTYINLDVLYDVLLKEANDILSEESREVEVENKIREKLWNIPWIDIKKIDFFINKHFIRLYVNGKWFTIILKNIKDSEILNKLILVDSAGWVYRDSWNNIPQKTLDEIYENLKWEYEKSKQWVDKMNLVVNELSTIDWFNDYKLNWYSIKNISQDNNGDFSFHFNILNVTYRIVKTVNWEYMIFDQFNEDFQKVFDWNSWKKVDWKNIPKISDLNIILNELKKVWTKMEILNQNKEKVKEVLIKIDWLEITKEQGSTIDFDIDDRKFRITINDSLPPYSIYEDYVYDTYESPGSFWYETYEIRKIRYYNWKRWKWEEEHLLDLNTIEKLLKKIS